MATPSNFLDQLLVDLRSRGDPVARATRAQYRASGASCDPRPAADPWEDRPWTPVGLVIKTHMQTCHECGSTSETLIGYFLKSTAPDGGGRQAARLQRVDSLHLGLPESFETTEEDVHQCPLCIRLEAVLREGRPHQLSLFPVARGPR